MASDGNECAGVKTRSHLQCRNVSCHRQRTYATVRPVSPKLLARFGGLVAGRRPLRQGSRTPRQTWAAPGTGDRLGSPFYTGGSFFSGTELVKGSLQDTVQRILDLANGKTAERPLSEIPLSQTA